MKKLGMRAIALLTVLMFSLQFVSFPSAVFAAEEVPNIMRGDQIKETTTNTIDTPKEVMDGKRDTFWQLNVWDGRKFVSTTHDKSADPFNYFMVLEKDLPANQGMEDNFVTSFAIEVTENPDYFRGNKEQDAFPTYNLWDPVYVYENENGLNEGVALVSKDMFQGEFAGKPLNPSFIQFRVLSAKYQDGNGRIRDNSPVGVREIEAYTAPSSAFILSDAYTVNYETRVISDIPTEEMLADFVEHISCTGTLTYYDADGQIVDAANYETTLVADVGRIEVTMLDGIEKLSYTVEATGANNPSLTSDVYTFSTMTIMGSPTNVLLGCTAGVTVAQFKENISVPRNATYVIYNAMGEDITASDAEKIDNYSSVLVTAEGGATATYFIILGSSDTTLTSDTFTIDEGSKTIKDVFSAQRTISVFDGLLHKASGSTVAYMRNGEALLNTDTLKTGDQVVVTSENGAYTTTYTIYPTYLASSTDSKLAFNYDVSPMTLAIPFEYRHSNTFLEKISKYSDDVELTLQNTEGGAVGAELVSGDKLIAELGSEDETQEYVISVQAASNSTAISSSVFWTSGLNIHGITPENASIEKFKENLTLPAGATYVVYRGEDTANELVGNVKPGDKVLVTAEDEETTVTYTIAEDYNFNEIDHLHGLTTETSSEHIKIPNTKEGNPNDILDGNDNTYWGGNSTENYAARVATDTVNTLHKVRYLIAQSQDGTQREYYFGYSAGTPNAWGDHTDIENYPPFASIPGVKMFVNGVEYPMDPALVPEDSVIVQHIDASDDPTSLYQRLKTYGGVALTVGITPVEVVFTFPDTDIRSIKVRVGARINESNQWARLRINSINAITNYPFVCANDDSYTVTNTETLAGTITGVENGVSAADFLSKLAIPSAMTAKVLSSSDNETAVEVDTINDGNVLAVSSGNMVAYYTIQTEGGIELSDDTTLTSSVFQISGSTISGISPENASIAKFKENLTVPAGATYVVYRGADTANEPVGNVNPGDKVKVTAENGIATAEYTVSGDFSFNENDFFVGLTTETSSEHIKVVNTKEGHANDILDGNDETFWGANSTENYATRVATDSVNKLYKVRYLIAQSQDNTQREYYFGYSTSTPGYNEGYDDIENYPPFASIPGVKMFVNGVEYPMDPALVPADSTIVQHIDASDDSTSLYQKLKTNGGVAMTVGTTPVEVIFTFPATDMRSIRVCVGARINDSNKWSRLRAYSINGFGSRPFVFANDDSYIVTNTAALAGTISGVQNGVSTADFLSKLTIPSGLTARVLSSSDSATAIEVNTISNGNALEVTNGNETAYYIIQAEGEAPGLPAYIVVTGPDGDTSTLVQGEMTVSVDTSNVPNVISSDKAQVVLVLFENGKLIRTTLSAAAETGGVIEGTITLDSAPTINTELKVMLWESGSIKPLMDTVEIR